MVTKKTSKTGLPELRGKAEYKLSRKKKEKFDYSAAEIEHELNVHKIELEMQNEELLSTQSKLVKSVENYTALFEFAPVAYFILDKNGMIVNVNKIGVSLLGVPKKKLIGKHLSIFIYSKSSQDVFYIHRHQVMETGQQHQCELQIKKNNGIIFDSALESGIMTDENNQCKFLFTVVNNISVQKEQERKLEQSLLKERELNEMKSQFITITSHEFRTPLSTILSSVELIENYSDKLDAIKRKQHFRKIKTSVSRLKEILMDFHSANDIENGNTFNHPVSFNITEFIPNLLEEVKIYNGVHSIAYKHSGNYKQVKLDKKLLKTCLTNLMINAFKFSPNGGKIIISTMFKTPDKLVISVRDQGIGIPEGGRERVFQPFFRAQNATHIQGTGLGLHITHKLVQMMGGSISFKSEENKGSTFMIKFQNI